MAILTPEELLADATAAIDLEPEVRRPRRPEPPAPTESLVRLLRWALVLLSLAAAALGFAFAPAHFSTYWAFGVYFVAVAWFQVVWGLGMLLRPSRALLFTGLLNGVAVAVWVLVHTAGLPIGPSSGVRQPVTVGNSVTMVVEMLLVVGVLALAYRRSLARRHVRVGALMRGLAAAFVVVLAGGVTAALVPGARGTARSGSNAAAGGAGGLLGGHAGHLAAAGALTGNTPCEKAGPPASEGQVLDSAGHFHRGPTPQQPIDFQTRLALQAQQEQARLVAAKFPTVADATKAGYMMSTVYVPCIGAHYTNPVLAGVFDPAHPSELLYDGTAPTARIIGLSYLVFHPGGAPEGFAGPNDVWHQHTFNGGLCLNGRGVVIGAEQTSKQECAARGGHKAALKDIWMLHDWVVPGFECSWGVFAAECPELGGRTGGTPYDPPDPSGKPIPQG